VIGDKIVAAMEGTLEPELTEKWRWRSLDELKEVVKAANDGAEEFISCEDGTRAGRKGMILQQEMARTTLNDVKH
jgi:hypothetical protein